MAERRPCPTYRPVLSLRDANSDVTPHPRKNRAQSSWVTDLLPVDDSAELSLSNNDIWNYCEFLVGDSIISKFLFKFDYCSVFADQHLLATVYIYFKRCKRLWTRHLFWQLLYLAHDMEEDEEYKWEIPVWALGCDYTDAMLTEFQWSKCTLWKSMNFRGRVTCKTTSAVIERARMHPAFTRVRPEHHSGAFRPEQLPFENYDYDTHYGPDSTPPMCRLCVRTMPVYKLPVGIKRKLEEEQTVAELCECTPPHGRKRSRLDSKENDGVRRREAEFIDLTDKVAVIDMSECNDAQSPLPSVGIIDEDEGFASLFNIR